ncbi:MAG: response regulator transcription factor [Bifidobacteriaceae bacterium]|jgi:DNA-binding NarL/FixJ family response regulator|nr:response regulator transcription factor [Bifidobacteriaceae bacterium]
MEPIRIILVDDQQLVRAGLALVIDSQEDMRVVGQAGDGAAALRLIASEPADIVLMDVRMPTMDGLTATERLTSLTTRWAPPKIVMLTTFDLDEYLLQAIRAGASGFLLKDAPPEEMLAAIRSVHAGDAVLAPSSTRRLLARVARSIPTADPAAFDALTEREREVLVLMARGLANAEIAEHLVVAEATVKTHVGHILAKLDARDRVQAVVRAYEGGLVAPGEDSAVGWTPGGAPPPEG